MGRDLFEEYGIDPYQTNNTDNVNSPRDLFSEYGIEPERETPFREGKFVTGLLHAANAPANMVHGLAQPLLESGYLGEGTKDWSQALAQSRAQTLGNLAEENPKSALLGDVTGQIATTLPIMGGAAAGVAKGLGGIAAKSPTFLKYLSSILGGGLGAGASAGSQYVNPGESRLENAAKGAAVGSALGVIPPALSSVGKGAKKVKDALSTNKIAKKVITDRANIRNDYKNYYSDLFKEAEAKGINNVKIPKLNTKAILENSTSRESKALEEFLREPSLKNAHSAQSDLGKIIRRLDKTNENVGLPTDKLRALESARQAQKKIKGSMFDAFNKSEGSQLANKYGKITEGYAKDVIPYTKSKPINTYKKGELTEKDFVNALMKDKKFKKQLGDKYPELETRKILEKLGKYGLVGGSGLGGVKLIKGLYF